MSTNVIAELEEQVSSLEALLALVVAEIEDMPIDHEEVFGEKVWKILQRYS